MTRSLWIFPLFIISTACLMILNIMVFGLGDPKYPKDIETALGLYFPIWLAFYTPQIVVGWFMLTTKVPVSKTQVNALLFFTLFTLFTFEISFILDTGLMLLAVEWFVAVFVAWLIRRWLLFVKADETAK